jgi:hypothetical protein
MNELEQRLRQVPLKPVPPAWRAEILAEVELGAASVTLKNSKPRAGWLFRARLAALLWPHPKAWAGLAAVWLVILALDFSQGNDSPVARESAQAPTPEMRVELRQQQQMLAELLGAHELSDADRPRPKAPQPHTELVRVLMT